MGFNPFEEIGKAAAGAGQFVQQAAGDAAKAVSEGAQQVVRAAGEGAGAATKVIGDGAGQAAAAAGDVAGQVAKAVNNTAGQVAMGAGNGARQVANQAVKVIQNDVAPALQQGANAAVKAADQAIAEAKKSLSGYVLKEEIERDWSALPKMIQVVDSTDKRPIDLEVGAIGWQCREGKLKVLHVYEDALDALSCEFFPPAVSKAGFVYYIDQLDAHRYINLEQYVDIIAEEKKAELLDIAYRLGAKHCHLECREEKISVKTAKATRRVTAKVNVEGVPVKGTAQTDVEASYDKYDAAVTLFSQEYGGSNSPQRPELHWYEHDPKIMQLIEARCDPMNELKCYSVEISDTKTVTFDLNAAANIDLALEKMKVGTNISFKGQATNEKRRKLIFVVEF